MARTPVEIPGPLGARRSRRWRAEMRRRGFPLLALLGEAGPRGLDLIVAVLLLLALFPILLVRVLASQAQTGAVLSRTPKVGRLRTPFERLAFAGRGPLRGLAVWINILRGDMGIVGPRPLSVAAAAMVPVEDLVRFSVRPGLVSPFGIRSRIGIAHDAESALDRDLVYGQTLTGDLGLVARSAVAEVLGGGGEPRDAPPVLNFFGIPVLNTDMAEAVDWIVRQGQGKVRRTLAFVNPDCLNTAWDSPQYKDVLLAADRVLPDGIGIHLGCRMQGLALKANVNGTDLFPLLCEAAAGAGVSLYLLGARPGIAAAAAEAMCQRWPDLHIAGTRDGYFRPEDEAQVVDEIAASGAGILLVAFGAPRQELWIARWRERLGPGVCMGVGGLFDFYSGRIPRAPIWLREMGLEWVWRLLQEPGRMWRRYVIGNPLFLYRVWRQVRDPQRFPLPNRRERPNGPIPSGDPQ